MAVIGDMKTIKEGSDNLSFLELLSILVLGGLLIISGLLALTVEHPLLASFLYTVAAFGAASLALLIFTRLVHSILDLIDRRKKK